MQARRFFALLALVAAAFFFVRTAQAADPVSAEKAGALARLDAAAASFHTATANFEFDSIQIDPIPDKDAMTGVAYYERNGGRFAMAAHIAAHNGRPAARAYIFSQGKLRISDTGKEKDARTYDEASKYESYLMLGFGASGKDLEAKWKIVYRGKEKIDGIVADKFELIARDPKVLKLFPKVTIWMDTARAVSLKQVFDEGEGQSRVCLYTHIEVNRPLPKTAFDFAK